MHEHFNEILSINMKWYLNTMREYVVIETLVSFYSYTRRVRNVVHLSLVRARNNKMGHDYTTYLQRERAYERDCQSKKEKRKGGSYMWMSVYV